MYIYIYKFFTCSDQKQGNFQYIFTPHLNHIRFSKGSMIYSMYSFQIHEFMNLFNLHV